MKTEIGAVVRHRSRVNKIDKSRCQWIQNQSINQSIMTSSAVAARCKSEQAWFAMDSEEWDGAGGRCRSVHAALQTKTQRPFERPQMCCEKPEERSILIPTRWSQTIDWLIDWLITLKSGGRIIGRMSWIAEGENFGNTFAKHSMAACRMAPSSESTIGINSLRESSGCIKSRTKLRHCNAACNQLMNQLDHIGHSSSWEL